VSTEGPDKTAGVSLVATSPRTVFETRHANEKVMVVLPWGKMTNPITAYSVMRLIDNRRHSVALNHGDAFVAHSRNSCVDLFLKSTCDWMLTIDDDMVVPFGSAKWFNGNTGFNLKEPFASFNALERLLAAEKTLVGALYFGRHRHGAPMFGEGANTPGMAAHARKAPHDEVVPTRWVATGCLLIHRAVYEAIEKRYPNLARKGGRGGHWFTSSEHSAIRDLELLQDLLSKGPMTGEKCLMAYEKVEQALARARTNSSLGMGEDVALCIRANESGHVAHVDLGLVCGHIGTCVYGPYNTFQKTPNTP
jgi:hypothetical protein